MKQETEINFAPCKEYNPFAFEVAKDSELTAEQREKLIKSNEVCMLRDDIYRTVDKEVLQKIGEALSHFSIEQLRYFYNQMF